MTRRPEVVLALLTAAPLLSGCTGHAAEARKQAAGLTREQHQTLLAAFATAVEKVAVPAGPRGVIFGTAAGTAEIHFVYDEAGRTLTCRAEISSADPSEGITPAELQALYEEEKSGVPTGGGRLEYVAEWNGAFLTRSYGQPIDEKAFVADMIQLGEASVRWSDLYLRVVERLRGGNGSSPAR